MSEYLKENSSFRKVISNLKPESLFQLINATGEISLLRNASYNQFKFYWGKVDPEFESVNSAEVLQEIFKSGKSISPGASKYYKERRLNILLDERLRLTDIMEGRVRDKKTETWRDFNNYRRLSQAINWDSTIEDLLVFSFSQKKKNMFH